MLPRAALTAIAEWILAGLVLGAATTLYEAWRQGWRWRRWQAWLGDAVGAVLAIAWVTAVLLWTVWGAVRGWALWWMGVGVAIWLRLGAPWAFPVTLRLFRWQRRWARRVSRPATRWVASRAAHSRWRGWWRRWWPPPPAPPPAASE
ncbi:MAG: hypothetical protein K6U14_06150 [Firmicutes bacterium]|nr:hypothetical protein [Alicyclobacillaceae bacterium]MCL6497201.1 hypothetical protein [Bacillota bacterium]